LFRETVKKKVKKARRCSVALSGGSTPKLLFQKLVDKEMKDWECWSRIHVFWVDERAVGPVDRGSNYRLAFDAFLSRVPVQMENIHRMRGEAHDLEAEAKRYEAILKHWQEGEWPQMDFVLLGLGADGHTASLFPGSPMLDENARPVVPAPGPEPYPQRITMTYPTLNAATEICYLVTGKEKAEAVKRVLEGDEDFHLAPGRGVRPVAGRVTWMLDTAAASLLTTVGG
jgi:6-phosphogluconolactonase